MCGRGEEVICGHMSHISKYEQGNISQFGGVPFRTIPNELDGRIDIKNIQSQGQGSTHQNQFAPTRTDRCAHQAVRGSLVKDTFQATIFIQVKQKVFINFRARSLGFAGPGIPGPNKPSWSWTAGHGRS